MSGENPQNMDRSVAKDVAKNAERDEQAALWSMAIAEGSMSLTDRVAFEGWVADAANARALDEAAAVWGLTDWVARSPEAIALRSAALADFDERSRKWRRPAFALATAMLALVLFGTLLLQTMPAEYDTDIGERRVAVLGDGSKLSLDGNTVVRVKLTGGRRELELVDGRARFNVKKDPLRPFEVRAGDKVVVATGTSFSVEVIGKRVNVVLYEGSVVVLDRRAVEERDAGKHGRPRFEGFSMKAGTEFVSPGGTVQPATVATADLARSSAWENGQLVFDDEPLKLATARMNRYSQRALRVSDARTGAIRVSGVFNEGDVDAFVEAVEALHPVATSWQDGAIVLTTRPRPSRD